MYFWGDLVYNVQRAYFKQGCIVLSDENVHTVVRVIGFFIFWSTNFQQKTIVM